MRLVLIREQDGFGRLFCDNRYLCFTREWGGVLTQGEYILSLKFNPRLNQELPKVPGDNELWFYPSTRSNRPPDGVAIGARRNTKGVSNGGKVIEKIINSIEKYLQGSDEVVLVVS